MDLISFSSLALILLKLTAPSTARLRLARSASFASLVVDLSSAKYFLRCLTIIRVIWLSDSRRLSSLHRYLWTISSERSMMSL